MQHSREEILKRIEGGVQASAEDDWVIDFELFEKSLNPKTKLLILNTPHNPSGKVFSEEELAEVARILQKHPQVIVIEDNVYEGMTFDEYFKKPLPKLCFQPGMYERSLSIYSAGKIFAATGVRSGWVIGPSNLIRSVRSVHQYNVFCSYNVLENTVANSLVEITRP
jgi:aspartate/methionine/tyrosine aminotransferase